jgi:hypothetical protein
MASVRIGRTDAFSAVEGSREELVRRGLTLKDLRVDAAKHCFVLLPHRWVVEHSFARAARFRRLARDGARPPITLAGCHCLVFVILMLRRIAELITQSA